MEPGSTDKLDELILKMFQVSGYRVHVFDLQPETRNTQPATFFS